MDTKEVVDVNRWNYERLGQVRLLRGVYAAAPGAADSRQGTRQIWLARVRAALELYAGREPVLYGATALQAMSVALPHSAEDWEVIHLQQESTGSRPDRTGVVVHTGRCGRSEWRRFDNLPVLHPVDHWLQMTGLTEHQMVEIGDGFLRRQQPLLTVSGINRRLDELAGAPGVKAVRRAMSLVRPDTESIYETKTRMALIRGGLPAPEVNLAVWCESVGFTYHVDMGYADAKVAVEYDGAVHVGSRQQMEIDADRRRNLQDSGWIVITVTAMQLRRPADVIRSVENALILRMPRMRGRR